MNTASDLLKSGATTASGPALAELAPCPACGNASGVPTETDDSSGGSVLVFEKRKVPLWRFLEWNRVASDLFLVPRQMHCCVGCGLVWGRIDPKEARARIRNSGSERLLRKLGEMIGPRSDAPATSA